MNHISDSAIRFEDFNTAALNKLQKLQTLTVRIAANSPYNAPSQPLLGKQEWQAIRKLCYVETAKMMYQTVNDEAPCYFSSLFERLSLNTVRVLRNTKIQTRTLNCLS